MSDRLRGATRTATIACALVALLVAGTSAAVLARAEYAAAARQGAALARALSPAERLAGARAPDSVAGVDGIARRVIAAGSLEELARVLPVDVHASRARIAREDRALVLGSGSRRVVTQPLKDADDWDIVGGVAVEARPFRGAWRTVWLAAVAAAAAGIAAMFALRAFAANLIGRARTALGGAILALGAGAWAAGEVVLERLAIVRAAVRHAGASSVVVDASALPLPPAGMVAVALAGSVLAGVAVLGATAWAVSARRRPVEVRETLAAWCFLAPSFLHIVVFFVGPLFFTLWVSTHRWDLLAAEKPFVGLANYREMFRDPLFWNALRNTAVYALYVPVTMALALGAALIVNQRLRGIRFIRAIVFLPYVVSYVAIAIVWQWIFNFDYGLLNHLLRLVNLPPVDWLANPKTALVAVMIVSAWVQVGYQMVVYLAGLQGIPESLYEAARLDGARGWQRLRYITLPLLRPVTVFIFVTGVIWSFQVFTLVYVMTEGGPVHSTDVLVYQIYQNAWEFRRLGYASAMSWVLFALLLALTLIQWRVLNRRVESA